MAKKDSKTVYLCSSCGDDFPKWVGKCPSCGSWNTLKEYTVRPEIGNARTMISQNLTERTPIPLNQVSGEEAPRIDMLDGEFNRVLGGGLVKGSLVLIGGEPGIGKSTLVLQSVVRHRGLDTLYISGEESPGQIRLRADRLVDTGECANCKLFSETDLDLIIQTAINERPDLLVIDSIQTMQTASAESSAGSLTQVRECTSALLNFAKEYNIPILIIGHITKDGNLAGPKVMEHLVDTVLRFEGDQNHQYRILRSLKNRFGNTSEIGIYEMRSEGLREVTNPSELLLTGGDDSLSGVCIAATIEGVRPLLIEVQALVSSAIYGTPQRSATGADIRRMNMLLAVLEKRAGFKLIQKDVFLNIAGGLRISDPALDLAILASVLSSNLDLPIKRHICVTGEVGLSGEVRAVSRIEQRISEAKKIGFSTIIVPKDNTKGMDFSGAGIRIVPVSRVDEAFRFLFKES
ncbi:DNA repair protein RadA [Porphyromonas sp.]|uniref:DNA repair protein RadA n=1 Tax=Porphyromonas sp. TaxID=1924944 RepID=UPI0026DC090C|nr:DNA repair protein RadA [Porphyromonas sp.]MDO4695755.1 DNA repair protein RadA [Porphyromonas sp.]MDO4770310.1 DNA repair protein RadA [Porphyromonas sp.]